jgi:hypothetical protein
MAAYEILGGPRTPEIKLNSTAGILTISGKSIPEDATEFYGPFIRSFSKYLESEPAETSVIFDMEYFNTASAKIISFILGQLSSLAQYSKVEVTWIYEEEDLDMKDTGYDYQSIFGNLINIQPKKIDIS